MPSAPGQLFESVPESPEVLEGLAAASYVLFEYPRAIDELERAYAGYRRDADGAGAARMARTLGYLYGSTAGRLGGGQRLDRPRQDPAGRPPREQRARLGRA